MNRLLLACAPLAATTVFTALVACGSGESDTASSSGGGAASTAASGGSRAASTSAHTSAAASGSTGSGTVGAGGGGGGGGSTGSGAGSPSTLTIGGPRPATVYIPPQYDRNKPMPLLMMLHGYTATGALEELYLDLLPQSTAQGFLYVHPDGTTDAAGQPFWNATDACCNFFGSTVDDDGYLMGLVSEIESKLSVDPKRIYVMGHSNGGFMAYRLACNHADKIAAIAVLAGEMVEDVSLCNPTNPVSLLHIQGTADATIAYDGGVAAPGEPVFPSATTSVGDWVTFDHCDKTADTSSPNLDIEAVLPGKETVVTTYPGCADKTDVNLWTIQGGSHIPGFQPAFAPDMTGWLMKHAKP